MGSCCCCLVTYRGPRGAGGARHTMEKLSQVVLRSRENNTTSTSVTFCFYFFCLGRMRLRDAFCRAPRSRILSPRNFSNRAQRSTQPRILLFSLETLICNRSPLPLPLAAAYVITSSCVGRSLSHTFGATFLAPKQSFAPR